MAARGAAAGLRSVTHRKMVLCHEFLSEQGCRGSHASVPAWNHCTEGSGTSDGAAHHQLPRETCDVNTLWLSQQRDQYADPQQSNAAEELTPLQAESDEREHQQSRELGFPHLVRSSAPRGRSKQTRENTARTENIPHTCVCVIEGTSKREKTTNESHTDR